MAGRYRRSSGLASSCQCAHGYVTMCSVLCRGATSTKRGGVQHPVAVARERRRRWRPAVGLQHASSSISGYRLLLSAEPPSASASQKPLFSGRTGPYLVIVLRAAPARSHGLKAHGCRSRADIRQSAALTQSQPAQHQPVPRLLPPNLACPAPSQLIERPAYLQHLNWTVPSPPLSIWRTQDPASDSARDTLRFRQPTAQPWRIRRPNRQLRGLQGRWTHGSSRRRPAPCPPSATRGERRLRLPRGLYAAIGACWRPHSP
jgi:hypothetical protein